MAIHKQHQQGTDSDLPSAGEAAAYLRMPYNTMLSWRQRKVGPPWYKIFQKVFYKRSELDEWINSQRRAV